MENGVETLEKQGLGESASPSKDQNWLPEGHAHKSSEADDVFEEAMDSDGAHAYVQERAQPQPSNLDTTVVGINGDEKLEKTPRVEDNGDICENFEEAMDRLVEDQSRVEQKAVLADVSDIFDGEWKAEGVKPVIELNRMGINGEGNETEVEEKHERSGVVVDEISENGNFHKVGLDEITMAVERGGNAEQVAAVIESNGLESNIVDDERDGDRTEILYALVDSKEGKDKDMNGISKHETVAVVSRKLENGDFDGMPVEEIEGILDQDESKKMLDALVNVNASLKEEKISRQGESQCMKDASVNVGPFEERKILQDENQQSEDALVGVSASVNEEKLLCEDDCKRMKDKSLVVGNSVDQKTIQNEHGSQKKKDTLFIAGSSADGVESLYQKEKQKMEDALMDADNTFSADVVAPQVENPHVEVPVGIDERIVLETLKSEGKDQYCSQVQLSGYPQGCVSDQSEVVGKNEEQDRSENPLGQGEGEKLNAGNMASTHVLLERESVSVEECGESSSTEEEEEADSELIMKPAQAMHGASTANSAELPPPSHPAGLGSSAPLLEPAPRAPLQPRANGTVPQRQTHLVEEPANDEAEEYDETREKLQMIRVKFLRLAHRLGQTPHNVVVAQVLYRLGLAEQLRGSRNTSRAGAFSFDRASAMAEQLEAAGQDALDFSCTILVLGKTGVGKSATINSIFDEVKFGTDAFQSGTKKVQDIVGMVQGIKVRVIDTPGLLSSCADQRRNEKILHSVKRFIKKTPPDIVLYLDRLDMQSRDFGDVPLLRTITDIFGPSIWFNAIVVLTHAACAPPEGQNGIPLSYEMFVTQRSHVVQQAIRQAAGDVRLMNPVSLVENHSACRTNRAGQRVLPNGQVWKPQLLLLSFASKILAEANTLFKLQDNPPGKPFGARARVPPLPFLLSSLLQSRPQLKLPEEQFGDDDTMDEDLDDASDSDDESAYDELPPFKRLTKAQLAQLSRAQKKAYFDELEHREKLFMKKQLKEEKMRRKLLKKMPELAKDSPNNYNENIEESGGPASVPVPVPDMPLPASFDSDNPTHRYRYLDNSSQWLIRPVLDSHGWDHDVGYEGLNVERLFVVKDTVPVSFSGQVTKDKKECNVQMELASSIKHGEGKSTSFGFDAQTIGKDMAYTLRSETRFVNFLCNKMAAGLSVTMLGDAITTGLKLEDNLMIHKRFRMVMTGGAMTSRGDVAYGGSLEATLRDKDHPIGRTLSTLGLSIMDWHGDLAIGCNVQSQFPVGRTTNTIIRANLNNRGSGQVSIRLNSSEQLQIALIALVPVLRNIIKNRLFGSLEPMK